MKTSSIDLGHVQIAIHEIRSGSKPQLVCIHGGMGLGSDSLLVGLTPLQKEFDLLFIDLRGCGKSSEPNSKTYELSEMATDVVQVLRKIPSRGMRGIFGHSLGGMVTVELLSRDPEIASFAVLANTALNDSWQPFASDAVGKISGAKLTAALEAYSVDSTSDKLVRDLAIEYGPIYFPELDSNAAKKLMAQFSYRASAVLYASEHVYPKMNLRDQATSLDTPTLIISGELDIVVPPVCQREVHNMIRNSKLELIRGAGHFPFLTKSNIFGQSITHWFNSIKGEV